MSGAVAADAVPRTRQHLDAALHPRLPMARHGAEIDELAGPIGGERHRALAALPTTRSERAAYCSTTMSCSAPSPLIRLICTVSPSCTISVGLTLPSMSPPTRYRPFVPRQCLTEA